ncbi:MAG: NAD(P)/FAD-dependent oxidoreductase [Clostridia bacterium]|nr:NAD(P)/FAD-dependent oxidoreductase [Clostridia bacterium]
MKRILVAGAGHGGLAAGAILAKNGFDVTVVEKEQREALGHDWEDRFTFSLLTELLGIAEADLPEGCWRYRGDCAFVSPAKRKKVVIRYTEETRQKIMWRKPLLNLLLEHAEKCGVKFLFGVEALGPLTENGKVTGLSTAAGDYAADLVIDAAGVFSPVRRNLPEAYGIEKDPRPGDLFYACRAYYDRLPGFETPDAPFEVYLYHEGERGLSWFGANEDGCDVLIGRTYPLTPKKVEEQLAIFRQSHPWLGEKVLHGGQFGVIPVRRPLTLLVDDGYAAVGDSAFMTTPMNGMGIDLSLQAGKLLAETVLNNRDRDFTAEVLWAYNRDFHRLYGGDTAKNEGLKNALLSLPGQGVDFLFEAEVIQSSDLAGAGKNTKLSALLGKFVRGMRQPKSFFTILGGLTKGAKAAKLYKNAPARFDRKAVRAWSDAIEKLDIRFYSSAN